MIGWLWRIIVVRFTSCEHHWEKDHVASITNNMGNEIGYLIVMRCKKCGEITHRSIEP